MSQTLIIDGVTVPVEAITEFDQDYEQLEASTFRRVANGDGVLRVSWVGKLRTIISGRGWAPSALINLEPGVSHNLQCAMPLSVDGNSASITIPANRRSDSGHVPLGFALVDGAFVSTPITDITANVCTLTTVAGATAYRVDYWPQLTVWVSRNTAKGSSSAEHSWTIEAEEF